jgi:hypothetical protein
LCFHTVQMSIRWTGLIVIVVTLITSIVIAIVIVSTTTVRIVVASIVTSVISSHWLRLLGIDEVRISFVKIPTIVSPAVIDLIIATILLT